MPIVRELNNLSIQSSVFSEILTAFDHLISAKGYKTGNGTMYQKAARQFLNWLEQNGMFSVEDIQSENMERYVDHLLRRPGLRGQKALGQISINHHLFGLRLLTDFLWETNRINYLVVIPPNQKVQKSTNTLVSRDQIAAIFSLTQTEQERAILSLAYGCGLRSQEVCDLVLSDIAFGRGYVIVRHGKGNKTREVPMSNAVQVHLRNYVDLYLRSGMMPEKGPRFLLMRPSGKPMHNNYLNLLLKKMVNRSDQPEIKKLDLSLHDLRHSIATHLAENGAGIEFVRNFLGHDSIDTSSLYMIRRKRRNRLIA